MIDLKLNLDTNENISKEDETYSKTAGMITISEDSLYVGTGTDAKKILSNSSINAEIINGFEKPRGKDVPAGSRTPGTGTLPGNPGFGGGIPSDKALLRLGMEKLPGSEDPESMNWSQYVHSKTGSVMCYTPKMYHKLSFEPGEPYMGLKVEFSKEWKPGFTLNRSFYNAGKEIDGIFVDKFLCSLKGNTAVSIKGGIPITETGENEAWPSVKQCTANSMAPTSNAQGTIDAAKSRGNEFFLMPLYFRTYWLFLMMAKYQHAVLNSKLDSIAWSDIEPHCVRGNNRPTLSDEFDTSIRYESAGVGRGGKTGGVSTDLELKKISILGDGTSPCDFNGCMLEYTSGLTSNGTQLAMLKKDYDIRNLSTANAFNFSNYELFEATKNSNWRGLGDQNADKLYCAQEENTKEWFHDMIFLAKATNLGGSAINLFCTDQQSTAMPANMIPGVGQSWFNSSTAYGLFFLNLNNAGTYAEQGGHWGFRAAALG